jgi:Xaa-Pro aminopeptidase
LREAKASFTLFLHLTEFRMDKRWFLVGLLALAAVPAGAQITTGEYAARRDSLAARIDSGIVIGFGGRTLVSDFSRFFQLPAFHYLTGYDEPDAAFVMVARKGHAATTLFVTKLEARTAFYYGQRADTNDLARMLGVSARSGSALPAIVDSLMASGLPVYTLSDFEDADFVRQDSLTRGQSFIKSLIVRHPGLVVKNAHQIVNQLRAHKSAAEIALLRKAAEISSDGHRAVLAMAQPKHEYDMQAVLESTFLREGGERPAYGSIVGAGGNSTLLHYMLDRGPANPGDIVVIDAATQVEGYAADVTRSIPVSGKYTPTQRAIYQVVRDAQAAAERNARLGLPRAAAWDSATAIRAKGLAALGLVDIRSARGSGRRAWWCRAPLAAGRFLDDSWHQPRARRRRARLCAGEWCWPAELHSRRCIHDRAGDLHLVEDARCPSRHAEESRIHRSSAHGGDQV